MIQKSQLDAWALTPWHQSLKNAKNKDLLRDEDKDKQRFWNRLIECRRQPQDYLKFKDNKVTGEISEGWAKTNQRGPLFQDSLLKVMDSYPQDWTPAEYLIEYFRASLDWGNKPNKIELGRALYALPSFVREYAIAQKISDSGFNVVIPNAKENAELHVDFTIKFADKSVTIWSYLATPNAIDYLIQKKIPNRGKIIEGLNLLAPIKYPQDTIDHQKWNLPKDEYVDTLIKSCKQQPEAFIDIEEDAKRKGFDSFRLFSYSLEKET